MNPTNELAKYIGDGFDSSMLAWDNTRFYRTLRKYVSIEDFQKRDELALYLYTHLSVSEWRRPYLTFVQEVCPPPQTVLDYHAGVGGFGLQLMDRYDVSFADVATRCTKFLRWRLEQRQKGAQVYDIEKDSLPHCQIVISFDAIHRYEPETQTGFLDLLSTLGETVVMNIDTINYSQEKSLLWSADVSALLKHIKSKHELVNHRIVNHYINLVAYQRRDND